MVIIKVTFKYARNEEDKYVVESLLFDHDMTYQECDTYLRSLLNITDKGSLLVINKTYLKVNLGWEDRY